MAEEKAKFGDLIKQRIVFHPEKCSGCYLCAMACSLRYEGLINPLKARTKIVRKGNIIDKLTLTKDCTLCGHCITACKYGARVLSPLKHA